MVPVQVTLTVWPILEGTVMLLVAGLDAWTPAEKYVIVTVIAVTIRQATVPRMIFILKLSAVARSFSEFRNMDVSLTAIG